ncbi:alpha/beta fold hydrolase [Confluentibacter flavum]|uniref:Alpha/beta hydrolase n=1 Tax=Confluentibacter flavum TaxID=1909700 RepID=A0A2N3HK57_9FLAO|nr:alpha/beta hydrolase [Confluentibacter flavum]PKQ45313.1 alpha/beta hydrolase [Confluentibacter flavum]
MNKYLPKIIGSSINFISHISTPFAVHLAFQLFSRPQKGNAKKMDTEFLNASIQKELHYQDISIMTYQWVGKKDTILLVHGWESNTSRWKKLIELLKTLDYNIITLDAPAHGNSGGTLFNAILYSECIHVVAKKIKPAIIIGHSVGGIATIISQHKYSLPSVKKVVLLGAPSNFTGIFDRYKSMMRYNKKVSNGIDQFVFNRFGHLPSYYHIHNFSENIHSQGLVIHDKEDRIIPYSDALDYQKHYKNSTLISTSGLGHGLKSKEINAHILDFINQ